MFPNWWRWQVNRCSRAESRSELSRGGGGRGIPSLHGGDPKGAECGSGDQVTLNVEEIADGTVDGDEALGPALGFEALHLPLTSSHSEMRILRPVVLS